MSEQLDTQQMCSLKLWWIKGGHLWRKEGYTLLLVTTCHILPYFGLQNV